MELLAELARWGCVLLSAGLMMYLTKMVVGHVFLGRPTPFRSSIYILLGKTFLAGSVLFSELARLENEHISWRLPINLIGVCLGLFGAYRYDKELDAFYREGTINAKVHPEVHDI